MLVAGQVYESTLKVGDGSTPASSVVLTITKPDGTTVAGVTPVNSPPGSGFYLYDYTLPAPGLYQFAWVTQGPGTAPRPEFINCRSFISVVSTAEIYAHLNKAKDTDYDELGAFMMAATELVESKVGICVPRSFTARVAEGRWQLVLPDRPVISVSLVKSIWSGGPQWDSTVLSVDGEAGIVYQPAQFDFWWGPWDVTYLAGRQVIPERWVHAAKEQVRHLWETQRGGQPPTVLAGEEIYTATSGWTFSVPRRVLELLEQDMVPSS